MDLSTHDLILVTLTGTVVGSISGFFGVGGGFLLVPLLNVLLDVPIEYAVGACACQILGLATTSLLARGIKLSHLQLPLIIAGGLFLGVLGGAEVLAWAKARGEITFLDQQIILAQALVLAIYFALMVSLGLFGLWETYRSHVTTTAPAGQLLSKLKIPPYAEAAGSDQSRISITALAWFGLATGFLSGLLGISGGLILLPGLVHLVGLKTQDAVIGSLVIVWMASAQATAVHAWQGNISIPLVVALLLGGTFGARIGSEFSRRIGGRSLRRWFAYLLLGTALLTGWKLLAILTG